MISWPIGSSRLPHARGMSSPPMMWRSYSSPGRSTSALRLSADVLRPGELYERHIIGGDDIPLACGKREEPIGQDIILRHAKFTVHQPNPISATQRSILAENA